MPVEIIPPMYQMLAREIQWAVDEVRMHNDDPVFFYITKSHISRMNHSFSHIISLSRVHISLGWILTLTWSIQYPLHRQSE